MDVFRQRLEEVREGRREGGWERGRAGEWKGLLCTYMYTHTYAHRLNAGVCVWGGGGYWFG